MYEQDHCLKTAVAWFTFDDKQQQQQQQQQPGCPGELIFTNGQRTVTSSTFDDRLAMGAVGFRTGRHYWEFLVDRYENQPDPAFGLATRSASKDSMLGKESS